MECVCIFFKNPLPRSLLLFLHGHRNSADNKLHPWVRSSPLDCYSRGHSKPTNSQNLGPTKTTPQHNHHHNNLTIICLMQIMQNTYITTAISLRINKSGGVENVHNTEKKFCPKNVRLGINHRDYQDYRVNSRHYPNFGIFPAPDILALSLVQY